MTTTNPVRIVILIDKSFSMNPRRSVVVNGINEFLSHRRAMDSDSIVSIFTFNNTLSTMFEDRCIREIPDLIGDDYVPEGCTSLYDSILVILGRFQREQNDATRRTLFLILTDGEDNTSVASPADVRDMFGRCAGFVEPIFMGSNMDAILNANQMGIRAGASLTYTDDNLDVAIRAASQVVDRATSAAMTENATIMFEFSDVERAVSMGDSCTTTVAWGSE